MAFIALCLRRNTCGFGGDNQSPPVLTIGSVKKKAVRSLDERVVGSSSGLAWPPAPSGVDRVGSGSLFSKAGRFASAVGRGLATAALLGMIIGSAPASARADDALGPGTPCEQVTMVETPDRFELRRALQRGDATGWNALSHSSKVAVLDGMPMFGLLPPADQQDRCLIEAVLERSPYAYRFIPEPFKSDRALAALAIRGAHGVFERLAPELQSDADLIELRFRTQAEFGVETGSRDDVMAALDGWPSLAQDADLIRSAADDNPQLLYYFDAHAARQLPEVRSTFATYAAPFLDLGIGAPERIADQAVWQELFENRRDATNLRGDPRPVAIVIGPKSDWNDAFENQADDIRRLTDRYRVMYYEISKDLAFADVMQEATDGGRFPAEFVFAQGHGVPGSVMLDDGGSDESLLDVGDLAELAPLGLDQLVTEDAVFVLWSCSVGAGGAGADNMVNDLYRPLFPGAEIWSYEVPGRGGISFDLTFDDDGRVTGAELGPEDDLHYVSRPNS